MFGSDFLPELARIVDSHAGSASAFLEWGAGLSTLLLAEIAGSRGNTYISIDHNEAYARSVASRIHPPAAVRLLACDLTGPKLGQTDQGLNYTNAPAALDLDFGFILIDGRRRLECLFMAFILSGPETVVVLHDYRRARYQAALVLFDVIEDGPQFRVLRAKPGLLVLTTDERSHLLSALRGKVDPG
jgi:predicted O-methyltransferase YrrM